MRTTIEIPDEFRAKLLEIAARRGQKGFSALITEALTTYLDNERQNEVAVRDALALRGSFTNNAAEELRTKTRALREHWR
jgi:predicted transcriptional regulator